MKQKSLYSTIINFIKEGISEGRFQPNSQIPTEKELVELFKVSRPTVNRALNELSLQGLIYRVPGKGSFVSSLDVFSTTRLPKNVISFIIPYDEYSISSSYELEVMRGAESYTSEKGYFLSLHFSGQDAEKERQLIKKCQDEGISGIILHPTAHVENTKTLAQVYIDNYPIVLIDRVPNGIPLTCVQSDNLFGGYEAARHLIECGYKQLYFVSHFPIHSAASIRDRFMGFYKAIKENGMPFSDSQCITSFIPWIQKTAMPFEYSFNQNPDAFREIAIQIINQSQDKTCGIFAINDEIAASIIKALNELKADIPGQFGIVGFGGTGLMYKDITTIKQNYFEIGRMAAKTVIAKINGKNIQSDTINIDVKLIVRETTLNLIKKQKEA